MGPRAACGVKRDGPEKLAVEGMLWEMGLPHTILHPGYCLQMTRA